MAILVFKSETDNLVTFLLTTEKLKQRMMRELLSVLTNTEKASFSVELRCLEEVCSPPVSLCLFDHNTFCLHRVNIALHDESLYV